MSNENMPNETSAIDAAILAALAVRAWEQVEADRDSPDKVEAFRIKIPGLVLAASTLRMVVSEVVGPDSSPEAVRARAASNKSWAEARKVAAKARGAKMAAEIERRRLAESVTKAEAALGEAQAYRARVERAEADAPQAARLGAVAAVGQLERELADARTALAEHQKAQVTP